MLPPEPSLVEHDDTSTRGQASVSSLRATRPRLAVAYDITSSSPMGLAELVHEVCEILWVVDTSDPTLGSLPQLLARLGDVFDTAGMSDDEVAGRLRTEDIGGALAFTDSQLPLAATIADSLGLPHNPHDVVARLNDKRLQREALFAAGIETPASCRIPRSADATLVAELAAQLEFPVVLKPRFGDSSRDVRPVASMDELRSLFDRRQPAERVPNEEFIAEEFLADRDACWPSTIGQYVSVESIVQDAEPFALAITGKFSLAEPFRETGNFMPDLLEPDEAAEVLDLADRAARAMGVRSGALHTEIKLTPAGPRVIEVNGRVGGGAIDALYARRHGRSLTELAARVALGQRLDLESADHETASGPFDYEYFVQAPTSARRIRAIHPTDALLGSVGAETVAVNRSAGDELDWRTGSQGYLMRVSGQASDPTVLASVPTTVMRSADQLFDLETN